MDPIYDLLNSPVTEVGARHKYMHATLFPSEATEFLNRRPRSRNNATDGSWSHEIITLLQKGNEAEGVNYTDTFKEGTYFHLCARPEGQNTISRLCF
jgi:hypothetical protein